MFSTQTGNMEDKRQRLSFEAEGNSETVGGDDRGDGGDATLEDAAEHEREYLRRRLRDELQREPTEEELNEWLREHTEGY
jgi:hypothetical protein